MGKTEGPEPEIRGGVGYTAEAILYGVNGLVDQAV